MTHFGKKFTVGQKYEVVQTKGLTVGQKYVNGRKKC